MGEGGTTRLNYRRAPRARPTPCPPRHYKKLFVVMVTIPADEANDVACCEVGISMKSSMCTRDSGRGIPKTRPPHWSVGMHGKVWLKGHIDEGAGVVGDPIRVAAIQWEGGVNETHSTAMHNYASLIDNIYIQCHMIIATTSQISRMIIYLTIKSIYLIYTVILYCWATRCSCCIDSQFIMCC